MDYVLAGGGCAEKETEDGVFDIHSSPFKKTPPPGSQSKG